jgi:general secretion pathway protein N
MAGMSLFAKRPAWMQGAGAMTTRWLDSTLEIARWENVRKAGRRWGWWGAGIGALAGLIVYAPASWLAQMVVDMTDRRVLLAESQGTIWSGNAVAVLTGGRGSRDARALPGRLRWRMGVQGLGLKLRLEQDCCMPTPVVILLKPGVGGFKADIRMQPNAAATGAETPQGVGEIGHWPAAWLGGLGTPWNTLQLGGVLRMSAQDLSLEVVGGRTLVKGRLEVMLDDVSSRVTPLDRLGSYRLDIHADPQGQVQMSLFTLDGALQLSGQGGMGPGGLRFQGEASARDAERGVLDNLLNIIGRRSGDRSVISIG